MATANDLAREIADLKRRLAAVERSSQLGRSSVDAGTLLVNDENGQPVLAIGRQDDGTYAVVGANGGKVVADTVPQEVLDELAAQLELADGAVTEAKLAAEAVTETKIADDAITTPKIVAGAVQAGQIAAGAVVAGKLATNSVLANNITANAVTADKIEAGSITADRLGVGTIGGELVPDGSFESADMRAQRAGGSWTFDTGSAAPRSHGDAFAQVAGSTTTFKQLILTDQFDVQPGEKYTGSFNYRGTSGTDGLVQLQMEVILQDGSKAFPQVGGQGTVADGTWRSLRNTVTMPANAVSAHIYLQSQNQTTGMWCADAVSVRRVLGGVEIGDGAVTADKLSADAINGKTITGATLIGGDPGGARIEITPTNFFEVYDATNTLIAKVDSDRIRVLGDNGSQISMGPDIPAGTNHVAGLIMNPGTPAVGHSLSNAGQIYGNLGGDLVTPAVVLFSPTVDGLPNSTLQLYGGTPSDNDSQIFGSAGTFLLSAGTQFQISVATGDAKITADQGISLNPRFGVVSVLGDITVNRDLSVSGAIDWNGATTVGAKNAAVTTTTSSSYSATATVLGIAFTAPPSGKVVVSWRSNHSGGVSGGDIAWASPEVRTGSTLGGGSVFQAADDGVATQFSASIGISGDMGGATLVTGLTPGASYHARLMHRQSGSIEAIFARRELIVEPKI